MSSQTPPAAPSHGGDSAFSVGRGMPTPLGALHTGEGVNFALFSRHATAISLHLFQGERGPTLAKIDLDPRLNRTGDIWHVQVSHPTAEVYRDLHYLWSAGGPNDPGKGFYYDLSRPLLDPYALALSGGENWGKPDLARENTPDAPPISQRRCRLVNLHSFDWENDIPPDIPIENTVIYELHVRGYTVHPGSGVVNPGTFIGLCEKIPYLRELGITAVELMPVFEFDENENMRRAPDGSLLLNYWGYSPISFFCPNASFAASPNNAGAVGEFRQMVKKFHQAGIEVYLDVVFNHTAEGDERGPTISFRGLDNPIYYMLDSGGRYRNFSGCGNTMNCNHPLVRSFILDVLRYWVAFMHVDGFRFDLASILGRSPEGEALVNPPVLEMIAMDPILARTKLIAEAWDAAGLNQVGNFPS
ncbi:MAG: glycogen debranching enzyme, partial [Planctomycetota bacterium]|nr:glycogen debranching enzyme [Planctomycetota bacterium]